MNDIILTIKIYRAYLGVKMLKSLVDQFEVSDFGLLKDMPPRHLAICFVNNKAVSVKMKNPYYTKNHPFHSKISTLRICRRRESEDRILYQAI